MASGVRATLTALLSILCWSGLFTGSVRAAAGPDFTDLFYDQTLRLDYLHTGDAYASSVEFVRWRLEAGWGGSRKYMIASPLKGEFAVEVRTVSDNRLVYSQGFSSLFNEWQTLDEAKTGSRTFQESIRIPRPRGRAAVRLTRRDKQQIFHELFTIVYSPGDEDDGEEPAYPAVKLLDSGDPAHCLDLVFLPEGYTEAEMDGFRRRVAELIEAMFSWSPYNRFRGRVNIWLVEAPSRESGTDIPHLGIWKDTILNSGFDAFGIERYLTTTDNQAVRELAAAAPYDRICIVVNSDRYGGAGIYNFYAIFTARNEWTDFLFMHEFAHCLADLADEYYVPEVSYQDMFDLSVEPHQENITTLVNFEIKWADMIDLDTPTPTPDLPAYDKSVGLFRGAAYQAEGMFRPYRDCTMKSKSRNNFCPVCRRAISRSVERCTVR